MLLRINKKTGRMDFQLQGFREFFRILLVRQNEFLLHEPKMKWYKPVERDEQRDIIICWRFPFSIFAKLFFILKNKWYNLARWFYNKGFIEKAKGGERIPLLWFTKIRFKRLKLLRVVRFTAGNRHCWCESTFGLVKKPIEKVSDKLLKAYREEHGIVGGDAKQNYQSP